MDEFTYRIVEAGMFFLIIMSLTVCIAYCCPMVIADQDICTKFIKPTVVHKVAMKNAGFLRSFSVRKSLRISKVEPI